MSTISKALFKFLFPPKCIICKKSLDEEGICDDCIKNVPFIKGKVPNPQFVTKTCTPLYYKDLVRASIIRYKFHGKTAYAEHFAKLICEMMEERIDKPIDYILWVPLGKWKLRRRGYDQAKLLAEEISKITGIPTLCAVKKVRRNKTQHDIKNVAARRANVVGVYECVEKNKIFGKNLLVADDVLTTGSTLSECAKILKIAGANEIFAATIAKTPPKSKKQLKKRKNSL